LLPLLLGENFLQPFSISSHLSAGTLGHLLCDFDPVHSHGYKILRRRLFCEIVQPSVCRGGGNPLGQLFADLSQGAMGK
jgi:hypothetical protein